MTLWHGARVKDALISATGSRQLVRSVEAGTHMVVDENVRAEVELGGALYAGQRLRVEARGESQAEVR